MKFIFLLFSFFCVPLLAQTPVKVVGFSSSASTSATITNSSSSPVNVNVIPPTSTSMYTAQPSVSSARRLAVHTSGTCNNAGQTRFKLWFHQHTGAGPCYIGTSSVSTTTGMLLVSGVVYQTEDNVDYYAVCGSATTISLVELCR